MRMDIVMGESRPAGKLTNEEIQLSLENARALLELRPPLTICVVLSIYASELLREINKRPDYEFSQRDVQDFPGRDIAKAIGHADAIRSVNPRLGVQVAIGRIPAPPHDRAGPPQGSQETPARITPDAQPRQPAPEHAAKSWPARARRLPGR
jgi:hypothetical protein